MLYLIPKLLEHNLLWTYIYGDETNTILKSNIMKTVNENGVTFYRLHVSKAANLTKAEANEKALKEMGFDEAFIVRI